MKKNRSIITVVLVGMSIVLVGAIFYISTLLSSSSSPTQIQKTKASAVKYTRTVDLPELGGIDESTDSTTDDPTANADPKEDLNPSPTAIVPTIVPTLLAKVPTIMPTAISTIVPTVVPLTPTSIPTPTEIPTPTLSPLLAYKSTSGITPTLIPIGETGGMHSPTLSLSPTKKVVAPTGVRQLPDAGWIQTSTILFIVATSTILFSLLF
jgi:hypothetical protein